VDNLRLTIPFERILFSSNQPCLRGLVGKASGIESNISGHAAIKVDGARIER
jgi:hypothetical protein